MESQKRLMKKQADENARQDIKTTLVLLRIVKGYVQWGHVGDSRLYYFKNGRIKTAKEKGTGGFKKKIYEGKNCGV